MHAGPPGAGGVAASWMDTGTELGQRDGVGTWGQIHVTSAWTRSLVHTVKGLRWREEDWGARHRICPRGSPPGVPQWERNANISHSELNRPMDKRWQMGLLKGFQQEIAACTPLQRCAGMWGCVGSVLPLHSHHHSLPPGFSEDFPYSLALSCPHSFHYNLSRCNRLGWNPSNSAGVSGRRQTRSPHPPGTSLWPWSRMSSGVGAGSVPFCNHKLQWTGMVWCEDCPHYPEQGWGRRWHREAAPELPLLPSCPFSFH